MKTKLFSAVLLLFVAACVHGATDIKLDLQLKKTTVEVGEAIPYDLVFTNMTRRDADICGGSPSKGSALDYGITITDESGKPLPTATLTVKKAAIGWTTIPAQKSLTMSDLLNYWSTITKPGNYTAKAWWKPVMSPWPPHTLLPDTADIQRSESAPVVFTVVEATPTGRDSRLKDASTKLAAAKTADDKRSALSELGLTLDERAVPNIVKGMRQSETAERALTMLNRLAATQMPKVRDAAVESLLAEMKREGPSGSVMALLTQLGVPDEKLAPVLLTWIEKGKPQQKAAAFLALSALDPKVMPEGLRQAILTAFSEDFPDVKRCALVALANARYKDLLDKVIDIAKLDKNPMIKSQAALTLGAYGDDKGVPILAEMIKSPKEDVALIAVAALEMIGSKQAEGVLRVFADTTGSLVQQRAMESYQRVKAKREGAK